MARLTGALFGGQWLTPESMELLRSEISTSGSAPSPTGYSFGWQVFRDDSGEVKYFEHGGETNGAYAFVRYFPGRKMAVAGVMNANFATGEPYFFKAISDDLPLIFGSESE